jgi:hypothetical protein
MTFSSILNAKNLVFESFEVVRIGIIFVHACWCSWNCVRTAFAVSLYDSNKLDE